jgi:outer membrane protein assembly factor BamB
MGKLTCLDAASGVVRWQRDLAHDFKIHIPFWGVGSQPLIANNLLVVMAGGASNACVIALDPKTGAEKWRNLGERPSYAPLLAIGKKKQSQVIVWTADGVHGLSITDGHELWGLPYRCKYDEAVHTPIFEEKLRRVYFPHDWFGTYTVQLDESLAAAKIIGKQQQ